MPHPLNNRIPRRINLAGQYRFLVVLLLASYGISAVFWGCSDEVTPPEKESFSLRATVVDTLDNPLAGWMVGRQNYLRGCEYEPLPSIRPANETAEKQMSYDLLPNYPNPFFPVTTIRYSLADRCRVILEIFDWQGERVVKLKDQIENQGLLTALWNARNSRGEYVRDGIYRYRLIARNEDTGSILFQKELLCTVYNSVDRNPLFTDIGQTNSNGVFETTDLSHFPCLQGFRSQTCYDAMGDSVGTCTFIDSVRLILSYKAEETDTTATYYRMFHKVHLVDEANSFRFTWSQPEDTTTYMK
jgi:hypothetical protein